MNAQFLTRSFLIVAALLQTRANAQGTKADYDRAATLEQRTANKVYRDRVRPQWLPGNSRFWYRVELAGGKREFILVDAEKGTRQPAFDHNLLAKALSKTANRNDPADRLPIDRIEVDKDGSNVTFSAYGKRWQWAVAKSELTEAAKADDATASLSALTEPRPSRRTGPETEITFVNKTPGEIELFWIDPDGERKSYGKLAAGDQRAQHTFSGHVWLAANRDGRTLAVYEAEDDEATAVIDGNPRRRPEPRRDGSRRGRTVSDTSPDGKWRASLRDHNVFVRNVESGQETALSTNGSADDPYEARFHWSPDSSRLTVLQIKPGEEHKIHLIESSPRDQVQPKLHTLDYVKPGDRIAHPRPRLFDVAAGKQIAIEEELFDNPWSLTDLQWSPDSGRFTFLYNQRGHQALRIIAVDAKSGEARPLIDEPTKTFIDYSGKFYRRDIDATHEIIWMSERDGWNHLYLYDADKGELKNQITRGEWVVRGVERVDEEKRQIWFRTGGIRPGQDPYYVHLARVNLDGTGLTILTEGDGTHRWEFSPDGKFLIDTWSRVDQPPVTELRSANDGELICELERAEWSELLKTGWKAPERFVAKARDGQTDIYGIIIRPTNFDPAKKYPVIEQIYAGPQGSFVPKEFGRYTRQMALAEPGFIIVQIDGMGTSNRSKAFHDVCWKNLGDAGFPDRVTWIKAAAEKHPEMDLARVGLYGGSAGGQNALRGLLAHGDFYKAAVADCGCHDNRMDKIWWNEQWMGYPVGPHYADSSNVTHAKNLQGKLLLIVGELDRNVDPASTMQVVGALVKANKDFDLLIMPGTGHGAAETPYANRRRMDFFVRHLLGVEPRAM